MWVGLDSNGVGLGCGFGEQFLESRYSPARNVIAVCCSYGGVGALSVFSMKSLGCVVLFS